MKKAYPNYKGIGVGFIEASLKAKDQKILNDFLNYCSITAGEKKLRNIKTIMLQIYDVVETSYDSFDLELLRQFLAVLNKSEKLTETQNDIKKVLKRFLKWKYRDWNERFAELRDILTKDGMNYQKLNSSTILTQDELEQLVRGAESLKYKAMIMLIYESAGRPEEILKLTWSDLDLDKGSVKLHSAKTGKVRVNPIKESIIHLQRYKQEYSYPLVRADDYVFPSPRNRKKPITLAAFYDYLRKIGTEKIGKHVYPYILRHTRLTQLHRKLSAKTYEKFAGHSIDVGTKRYIHLSNDDVRDEMLEKVYHVEELSEAEKDEVKQLKVTIKEQNKQLEKFKKEMHDVKDSLKSLKDLVVQNLSG